MIKDIEALKRRIRLIESRVCAVTREISLSEIGRDEIFNFNQYGWTYNKSFY